MRVFRMSLALLLFAGFASSADAARVNCTGGFAGPYRCSNVDLLAQVGNSQLSHVGVADGSDIWGWTDPVTGTEYAIITMTTGTAFVDLSDPENPVVTALLPSSTGVSSWRDAKVYADHAYVVSDSNSLHGMQVYDLSNLRTLAPNTIVAPTFLYTSIGSAHNLVINEDSGYAYIVGGSSGTNTCSGGLHMVDLSNPALPVFDGCFSADGYTHDAQCVNYAGPDPDHQGKEICMNSNTDTLTIVDVTAKNAPAQLSRTGYDAHRYTHQGWLTDDHKYFLMDDELDELHFGHNTRTRIWDVSDLDAPVMISAWDHPTEDATDHNQYVHQGFTYQANYGSGLRILDIADVPAGDLTEVAYFDVYPDDDFLEHDETAGFFGAWSVYPYFESGIVIVSSLEGGLFVLEPHLPTPPPPHLSSCETPVFADDFELGNFGSWSQKIDADNDLSIHAGAALEGTLGLDVEVRIPNDKLSFLLDNSPSNEDKFCFSFRVDADGMTIPEGRFLRLWGAQDSNGIAMAVVGIRNTATGFKIGTQFRRNGSAYDPLPLVAMQPGVNEIEVEWQRANGGNNGILKLWVNGALAAERSDLNGTRLLRNAGFGMLGKGAGVLGTLYLDSYESRR